MIQLKSWQATEKVYVNCLMFVKTLGLYISENAQCGKHRRLARIGRCVYLTKRKVAKTYLFNKSHLNNIISFILVIQNSKQKKLHIRVLTIYTGVCRTFKIWMFVRSFICPYGHPFYLNLLAISIQNLTAELKLDGWLFTMAPTSTAYLCNETLAKINWNETRTQLFS